VFARDAFDVVAAVEFLGPTSALRTLLGKVLLRPLLKRFFLGCESPFRASLTGVPCASTIGAHGSPTVLACHFGIARVFFCRIEIGLVAVRTITAVGVLLQCRFCHELEVFLIGVGVEQIFELGILDAGLAIGGKASQVIG
jgi:hypothetical protein